MTADAISRLVRISPHDLTPAPENDVVYRPIDPDDPSFRALVESVAKHGILQSLHVTCDRVVVSGHRRRAAAIEAGLDEVPCHILHCTYADLTPAMLAEYNRQRVKTLDEILREEVVTLDPDAAHTALINERVKRSDDAMRLRTLNLGDYRGRSRITAAKKPMLDGVLSVLEKYRRFWPMTVRGIHYPLLNIQPLRHAKKPASRYVNNRKCYNDLDDLTVRARLAGIIPMEAITDETRPVVIADTHTSVQPFIARELDGFLQGYWRDLMQSQPNHVEIIGEKATLQAILQPVALEFCVPLTLGKGFCSLPPRAAIVDRFRKSGKQKLLLLTVADHDPEGCVIPTSFARSLRDDFGVDQVHAVKVALTAEQAQSMDLPPSLEAKKSSPQYKKFFQEHGTQAWELEALEPEVLQELLRDAILESMDIDAFNHEVEAERNDAAFLGTARQRAAKALEGVGV